MQDYTEPSLNKRIREKAIRNESLDRNTEKNVKRSAVFREAELHSAKDLGVGIAKNVERSLYRTF